MEEISYDDFSKLDLRVAKIESVEKIEGKTRIFKGIILLGDEKREVIIGGANFYDPEELVGRLVIVTIPSPCAVPTSSWVNSASIVLFDFV